MEVSSFDIQFSNEISLADSSNMAITVMLTTESARCP